MSFLRFLMLFFWIHQRILAAIDEVEEFVAASFEEDEKKGHIFISR